MSTISLKDLKFPSFNYKPFQPDIVYVNTNESHQKEIQESLKKTNNIGNLFIGVSGLYNFNIASLRDTKYILIFDISQTVKIFYSKITEIIKNNNRNEAIKKIIKCIETNKNEFFKDDENVIIAFNATKNLQQEIEENLSFLSSDERYKKIKNIIENNNFHFVNLDIYQNNSFDEIAEILRWSPLSRPKI